MNQKNEFQSIATQSQKRKNFKNIFYSPKSGNGKDAFTEPHSKVVSVAQTKENSPMRLNENYSGVQHVP